MSLKEKLQNMFSKSKEVPQPQTAPQASMPQLAQDKKNTDIQQERIQINMEKASGIALEIDILRSNLLQLMSYAPTDRIREIDAELEETEAALKGAKVATAELGNTDEIAVSAIREMKTLLCNPDKEAETAETLKQLKTALQEDWFRNGEENTRKLRRRLSGILVRENIAALDQQIAGMKEWARKDAVQLKALMDAENGSTEHSTEIMRLSNHIKKLKLGITGKEALKTELSTIQDALTYSLLYATGTTSIGLTQKEGEIAETELTQEIQNAAEEKHRITEKLISDKVNADMLSERMAEAGIALPDLPELKNLISEFVDPEEMLLNPETVQLENKPAAVKENDNAETLMA